MKKKDKNDITLKVFALLIAIVLWAYVMSEVNPEEINHYRNIEIEFTNYDLLKQDDLEVLEPKEAKITVSIRGKKSDLTKFNSRYKNDPSIIKALADLNGYDEGQRKVPIKVTLDDTSDVKIDNFEPREVMVTFDKIITEQREIKIETTGKLKEGYVLGDLTPSTEVITLKGPKSLINEIREIVAFVDLNGMIQSQEKEADLRLLDSNGNDVTGVGIDIEHLEIAVEILRNSNLPISLNLTGSLPENMQLVEAGVNPKMVNVKGDKSILKLKEIKTKEVNIEKLLENENMEVELDLPEGAELVDQNQKFTAYIKSKETAKKTIPVDINDIEIKNLNKDYEFNILNNISEVLVVAKGNKDDLETLNKNDFNLFLNLEGLAEGVHSVRIQVIPKEGVTLEEILPQTIDIELKFQ